MVIMLDIYFLRSSTLLYDDIKENYATRKNNCLSGDYSDVAIHKCFQTAGTL